MLGRSIFVTGSNRGIGLEFIKQMLSMQRPPQHILAACRNPETAENLHQVASNSSTTKIHLVQLDSSKPDTIPQVVDRVKDIVGENGLNTLINNAGIMHKDSFRGVTVDKLYESFTINAVTPLLLMKNLYPLLRLASKQHSDKEMSCSRSAVVNISAILGSIHTIGVGHVGRTYSYSLSKAALNMAAVSASEDMKKDRILNVCLHPGWVSTDLGGAKAPVTVEQSVEGMLNVLQGLGSEHTGQFYDYTGKVIPW